MQPRAIHREDSTIHADFRRPEHDWVFSGTHVYLRDDDAWLDVRDEPTTARWPSKFRVLSYFDFYDSLPDSAIPIMDGQTVLGHAWIEGAYATDTVDGDEFVIISQHFTGTYSAPADIVIGQVWAIRASDFPEYDREEIANAFSDRLAENLREYFGPK